MQIRGWRAHVTPPVERVDVPMKSTPVPFLIKPPRPHFLSLLILQLDNLIIPPPGMPQLTPDLKKYIPVAPPGMSLPW